MKYQNLVNSILNKEEEYKSLSNENLKNKTTEFKEKINKGLSLDDILVDAFATVRETAARTLNMRHFPVQLCGGITLHKGKIAEMKTGEGKTLVATCPAYLNALTGKGVHIVTVNDYLAKTNADQMKKIFNFLGLTVACITADTPIFDRKDCYNCDIIYGTNKEFGFDYLRDNMAKSDSKVMQRDFNFVIIDEVDSILIDEARTPLIISGALGTPCEYYEKADIFAKKLNKGYEPKNSFEEFDANQYDFIINLQNKTVHLTDTGVKAAEDFFNIDCLGDINHTTLSHCIQNALKANYIMNNGEDYIVKNGEVIIVDNFTGRLMDGRRFNDGLHQAIEAKEGVPVQQETRTFASITLQNYFRMYNKLSGMTGTALTEKKEFKTIYGLDVVPIPTNKPVIRKDLPDKIFLSEKDKFTAIVNFIHTNQSTGQPMLIGTSSIEQSEKLSKILNKNRIKHQVLNAKQFEREAEIIAQAGSPNTITIATNMAGRGTDILLGGNPEFLAKKQMKNEDFSSEEISFAVSFLESEEPNLIKAKKRYNEIYNEIKKKTDESHKKVVDLGGLIIIGTERHEAQRIDNQLRGRAGRQGDPGQSQFFVSLEDKIIKVFGNDVSDFDSASETEGEEITSPILSRTVKKAQHKIELQNYDIRKNVLEYDDVANLQRKKIYEIRSTIRSAKSMDEYYVYIIKNVCKNILSRYFPNKKVTKDRFALYLDYLRIFFGGVMVKLNYNPHYRQIYKTLNSLLIDRYNYKKKILEKFFDDLGKQVLISTLDRLWMDYLEDIDAIKKTNNLTALGNVKPIDNFKFKSYTLFTNLIKNFEEESLKSLFDLKISVKSTSTVNIELKEPNIPPAFKKQIDELAKQMTVKAMADGKYPTKEEIDEAIKKMIASNIS